MTARADESNAEPRPLGAMFFSVNDERPEAKSLLANLKSNLPLLEQLLVECDNEWGTADAVYRFYHQSFKVYHVQEITRRIVEALQALAPDRALNAWFRAIVHDGSGKKFTLDDNRRWLETTRPILEAHFHARHFLEMAVKSGRELNEPPSALPNSWASVLYLYGLR